jgi:hypothetical protein
MKILAIAILTFYTAVLHGQEIKNEFDGHKWEAPYLLPLPKDWGVERFLIPISFAPQISYKGVEDIRFAPGWAKVNSAEYWSYAFLWYLDGKVELNAEVLGSNLKNYYTGLIAINGSKIPKEKIIPVETSFKEIKKDRGDLKCYTGTIKMTDYMQQMPMVLNCKVHLKACAGDNKTFVFFELSPQPLHHNIWLSLDNLWSDFKCSKTNL